MWHAVWASRLGIVNREARVSGSGGLNVHQYTKPGHAVRRPADQQSFKLTLMM